MPVGSLPLSQEPGCMHARRAYSAWLDVLKKKVLKIGAIP